MGLRYQSSKLELKLSFLLKDTFQRYHHLYSPNDLIQMRSYAHADRVFFRHGSLTTFALVIMAKLHTDKEGLSIFKALEGVRAASKMKIASSIAKLLSDTGIEREWGEVTASTRRWPRKTKPKTARTSKGPDKPPSQQTNSVSTSLSVPVCTGTTAADALPTAPSSPNPPIPESSHPKVALGSVPFPQDPTMTTAYIACIRRNISKRLNRATTFPGGRGISLGEDGSIVFAVRTEYVESLARELFEVKVVATSGHRSIYKDGRKLHWGVQGSIILDQCDPSNATQALGKSLGSLIQQGGSIRLEVPGMPFRSAALTVDHKQPFVTIT